MTIRLFAAVACALFLLVGVPSAHAEQANLPHSVLKEAPYQLEVTVLSVEVKKQAARTQSVWHRVRVDRVMVTWTEIKPGDEISVVSSIYTLPRGATGGTGHRADFKGIRGLPVKGDRARLYADAAKNSEGKTLTPLMPNGWQPVEPVISLIAADEHAQAERAMPVLAALIEQRKLGEPSLHCAASCWPDQKPQPDAKNCFTNDSKFLYAGDVIVLAARDLAPGHNTSFSLNDALVRPIVALRSSVGLYAKEAAKEGFSVTLFGTELRSEGPLHARTRILPPEKAEGFILKGLDIPAEGWVLPSAPFEIAPLTPDCRVLLWGRPESAEGKPLGEPRPVLWVRELPRKVSGGYELPPRRVAVTTLGTATDLEDARFQELVLRLIAWAGREEHRLAKEYRYTPAPAIRSQLAAQRRHVWAHCVISGSLLPRRSQDSAQAMQISAHSRQTCPACRDSRAMNPTARAHICLQSWSIP